MHWSYAPFDPDSDLEQGDILVPTTALKSILEKVHRHFCDSKYIGFIVATQSCDLVRRKADPKAKYISIAVIRTLNEVVPALFNDVAHPVADGVFPASRKTEARQFLHRLFDQNEQLSGLFYLHHEADIEIGESCVAMLRIKVALRSEHYKVLVEARRGRLDPEFRGKFGWLLGNLYSRAATRDWSDFTDGKAQLDALVNQFLEQRIEGRGPYWVDDELIANAKKEKLSFTNKPSDQLVRELEKYRPPEKIERLADEIISLIRKTMESSKRAAVYTSSKPHIKPSTENVVSTGPSASAHEQNADLAEDNIAVPALADADVPELATSKILPSNNASMNSLMEDEEFLAKLRKRLLENAKIKRLLK